MGSECKVNICQNYFKMVSGGVWVMNISKGKLRASRVEFSIQLVGVKGHRCMLLVFWLGWRRAEPAVECQRKWLIMRHGHWKGNRKPGQSQTGSPIAKAESAGQGYGSCGPMKLQSVRCQRTRSFVLTKKKHAREEKMKQKS